MRALQCRVTWAVSQLFTAQATGGAASRRLCSSQSARSSTSAALRLARMEHTLRLSPKPKHKSRPSSAQEKYPPLPYFQGRWSNGHVYTEYLANALGLRLVNNAVGGATTGAYNNSVLNVIGSFPDPRRCQPPGSPPGCPAQVCALSIPARPLLKVLPYSDVAAQRGPFHAMLLPGALQHSRACVRRHFADMLWELDDVWRSA